MSKASGSARAWAIHLFTASSAVLAFLALAAIEGSRWREALLWLLAALAVDGVDGTLARHADVTSNLPKFDGSALDLVVDYLTYVFVPAWFLWQLGAFPTALALPLVALILVSSLYTFARRDMKTDDGYFRGFPALWNVIALYVYVTVPSSWLTAAVTFVLSIMTFAPIHVVHPLRVRDYGAWLFGVTIVWGLSTLALLLPLTGRSGLVVLTASLSSAAILIGMGLVRSLRGARQPG